MTVTSTSRRSASVVLFLLLVALPVAERPNLQLLLTPRNSLEDHRDSVLACAVMTAHATTNQSPCSTK